MVAPMFNIGGLSSGLDTNSIIDQLLQMERQPIVKMQSRQAKLRTVDSAWGQVNTKLSGLRTALEKLDRLGDFKNAWTATSSNTAVATASVTGTPTAGSVSFSVGTLASAKQLSSSTAYATTDTLVGDGTFTVDVGGTQTSIDTTGLTVADLVKQVDAVAGVRAQAVSNVDGFHLVLSAEKTGTANAFTVSALQDDGTTPLLAWNAEVAATDAQITLAGMTVTRPTNGVDDLVDGVTLDLRTTGDVTVTTSRDVDGVVSRVKSLVEAVNGALTTIKSLSSYNTESGAGGALNGNGTARGLTSALRSAVSDVVSGLTGSYSYAGSIGISLTRDGAVELDEAKLNEALADDFAAVTGLFARGGTPTDPDVSYIYSSDDTTAGSYGITVATAATVASRTGTAFAGNPPQYFLIKTDDGSTVTVHVDANVTTTSDLVARINAALEAADVSTLEAYDDGGAVAMRESRYGSGIQFTVVDAEEDPANPGTYIEDTTPDWDVSGLAGTWSGTDVVATVTSPDGTPVEITGSGQFVTVPSGQGEDLQIKVAGTATGDRGTLTVTEGLAGRLSRVLSRYEGSTGAVQGERDRVTSQIDLFDDRIEAHEIRVSLRETTLRRQFTAMESALATLQSQGNWMASQLGSLNAQTRQ